MPRFQESLKSSFVSDHGRHEECRPASTAAHRCHEHLATSLVSPRKCQLRLPLRRRDPCPLRQTNNQVDHLRYSTEPSAGRTVHTRAGPIRRQCLRNMRPQDATMSRPLRTYRTSCPMLSSHVYGSGVEAVESNVYILSQTTIEACACE